jgi:urea transporter
MNMKKMTHHFSEFMKSISQTFFFRQAYFGAGLLLLFLYFSPGLFVSGLAAALVGYVYTVRYPTQKLLRDSGLVTINGFFFGIALASQYRPSPAFYLCLVLGALSIPLLTKAAFEVLQHWKLSPLIISYILAIWVISLCLPARMHPAHAALPEEWGWYPRIAVASFRSMGRLLFVDDALFGVSLLGLISLFSPRRGLYFLAGTVIATCTACLMSPSWEYGEYGYSAGLIGLGLASFPEKHGLRRILLFCAISSILTMAMDQFLKDIASGQPLPHALPLLSLPYVLTLWLARLGQGPRISLSWNPHVSPRRSPHSNTLAKTAAVARVGGVESIEEVA